MTNTLAAFRCGKMDLRRTIWAWVVALICGGMAVAAVPVRLGFAQTPAPPADLIKLERQVALKIAHVRVEGPTNAADLKQLGLAQRAQLDGEKALATGDYQKAEQNFLRANVIVTAIGE